MTAKGPELLPCPFCGGMEVQVEEVWPTCHTVACTACNVIGPNPHAMRQQSADQAIKSWNRRANVGPVGPTPDLFGDAP